MKKWESASRPETADQMQYHIGLRPGDIAPTVLLPGDPDRATMISKLWDSSKSMARKRSYLTYTGVYKNTQISTTSTGIGCPATAIAIEELATIGAKTFIRVGSSGAIQKGIQCGDLIISTGAVRNDGTSIQYVTPRYPAVAHYQVPHHCTDNPEGDGHHNDEGLDITVQGYCQHGKDNDQR